MKKITGDMLAFCKQTEKEVWEALQNSDLTADVIKREVVYEWCNSYSYLGITYLDASNIVTVRLSTKYNQEDGSTLRHELIHAFLPRGEKHGKRFMHALDCLNQAGMKVKRYGSEEEMMESAKCTMYKYRIYTSKGHNIYKMKKTKCVAFVLANQGIEIQGVRYWCEQLR